jgi:hypothetical protein
MTTKLSNAAAAAKLAALTALLNGGSLKIYTGSAPASVETAATGTLLATLALSATSFGTPSATSGADATAAANAITTSNAVAGGTAGYYRLCKSDGTAIQQGAIGTSGSDLNLITTTIVSGQPVQITSWSLTEPVAGA